MPWYIVEVTIEAQTKIEYKAEDGEVYYRRHGMTETKTGTNVRCDRCGNMGHLARSCPKPKTCHKCGDTGHLEARCHKSVSIFQRNNNKV